MILRAASFLLIAIGLFGCAAGPRLKYPAREGGAAPAGGQVLPGLDVLLFEKTDLLSGKNVGLITNPTGVTRDLRQNIDAMLEAGIQVVALYGPEHGVRGDVEGGVRIESYKDERTGLPVYSLYGETRKPTPQMLAGVDVLVYDIQDIGIRPYTYIYTMALAMEVAKEQHIPFVVLDRPNPLGGERTGGPVLEEKFKSFIGMYPIPYLYGLTVGELAQLFNEEFGIGCDLTVVPLRGWTRSMHFQDTGLVWVPTSPHVPHALTALFCATTGGIGELGTISEGVGTPAPFELIGSPGLDADKLASELNRRGLPGVHFRPVHYRPFYFRFASQLCHGVQIHILNPREFRPVETQVHILTALRKLSPTDIFATERVGSFDRAWGTDRVRRMVAAGAPAQEIIASWEAGLRKYQVQRDRYLLY